MKKVLDYICLHKHLERKASDPNLQLREEMKDASVHAMSARFADLEPAII